MTKHLHFVAGIDIDWEKTAKLPPRKDGRFSGVVELTPARRREIAAKRAKEAGR